MRRFVSILFIITLLFSGCSNARQIETASIIENVSVCKQDGKTVYTFYRLTSGDEPWGIDIRADSFEEACGLADREYIPNLSLAKLELLLIGDDVYEEVMQRDVDFISTQPSFSPIAYVTLCDGGTMKQFRKDNRVQRLIEEQLILLKKNNPEVCINYLSIFNHFADKERGGFTVPYINSDKELKVSEFSVKTKK